MYVPGAKEHVVNRDSWNGNVFNIFLGASGMMITLPFSNYTPFAPGPVIEVKDVMFFSVLLLAHLDPSSVLEQCCRLPLLELPLVLPHTSNQLHLSLVPNRLHLVQ